MRYDDIEVNKRYCREDEDFFVLAKDAGWRCVWAAGDFGPQTYTQSMYQDWEPMPPGIGVGDKVIGVGDKVKWGDFVNGTWTVRAVNADHAWIRLGESDAGNIVPISALRKVR